MLLSPWVKQLQACNYSTNPVSLPDLYFDSFSYHVASIVFGDMAIVSLFLLMFFLANPRYCLERYRLDQEPVMGSWPNKWDCHLREVFRFFETHTFARNILPSCLNTRRSEGLLVAFDILVTLYERDDRNCSHRFEETIRFLFSFWLYNIIFSWKQIAPYWLTTI